ncbi:hypothetical protein SNEBB_000809 [Seison nebaliae]|nr:hypothetical protein SNEBB_000809 [Seison nebaliae]
MQGRFSTLKGFKRAMRKSVLNDDIEIDGKRSVSRKEFLVMEQDKLQEAARKGDIVKLNKIMERECNTPGELQRTPVHWAALYGRLAALQLLISRGGEPERVDIHGNSALHLAVIGNHIDCIHYLIKFNINMWLINNKSKTALALASEQQSTDVIHILDDAMMEKQRLYPKHSRKDREKAVERHKRRMVALQKFEKKYQKSISQRSTISRNTFPDNIQQSPQPIERPPERMFHSRIIVAPGNDGQLRGQMKYDNSISMKSNRPMVIRTTSHEKKELYSPSTTDYKENDSILSSAEETEEDDGEDENDDNDESSIDDRFRPRQTITSIVTKDQPQIINNRQSVEYIRQQERISNNHIGINYPQNIINNPPPITYVDDLQDKESISTYF